MPEFFDEFAKAGSSEREIRRHPLSEGLELVSFPTFGSFVRGYVLLAPISQGTEYQSLGELPEVEYFKAAELIETYRRMLRDFNSAVILGEHGDSSQRVGFGGTCSCVREAHAHLIPVQDRSYSTMLKMFARGGEADHHVHSWEDLRPHLIGEHPYVLMSTSPRNFFIWKEPLKLARLGSQAVRKACAEALGLGDKYDWKTHRFPELMEATRKFVDRNIDLDLEATASGNLEWTR
jgi:hypothetical protein